MANGPVNAHLISWPRISTVYDVRQKSRVPHIHVPSFTALVKVYLGQSMHSNEFITVTFLYINAYVAKFDLAEKLVMVNPG